MYWGFTIGCNTVISHPWNRELEVPQLSSHIKQYFFKRAEDENLVKLTTRNLLKAFEFTEFINPLRLFLNHSKPTRINEFGIFALFDVINTDIVRRAYRLTSYELLAQKEL